MTLYRFYRKCIWRPLFTGPVAKKIQKQPRMFIIGVRQFINQVIQPIDSFPWLRLKLNSPVKAPNAQIIQQDVFLLGEVFKKGHF